MPSFFDLVQNFHRSFGHPSPAVPTAIELNRATKRGVWTVEEVVEMLQQSAKTPEEFQDAIVILKEGLEDAIVKSAADTYNSTEKEVITGQLDALIDQLVFVTGSLVEMGIDPKVFFEIVMQANMAKLGEDGKPIIRESDGKIMKPEGWEPPEPKLLAALEELIASKGA